MRSQGSSKIEPAVEQSLKEVKAITSKRKKPRVPKAPHAQLTLQPAIAIEHEEPMEAPPIPYDDVMNLASTFVHAENMFHKS
jgi:hypothetical protein